MIPHSKPTLDKQDIEAVISVLESNHLEEGDNVKELENHFQNYLSINFASAVSSGFASIHLALKALNIKPGDEVILPSYCCAAVLNPVLLIGAIPVVVDIEPESFNISVEEVFSTITPKTKAIIAPHIFGFPCKIDELILTGIPVIEDCAQSIGGVYKGKKTGTFGTLSTFSFYATKMICGGDGGLITTQNEDIYNKILDFRYYGHKTVSYTHLTLPTN
jgi:dTDP-4-amino-4,6-dideoxygalactose transaminase